MQTASRTVQTTMHTIFYYLSQRGEQLFVLSVLHLNTTPLMSMPACSPITEGVITENIHEQCGHFPAVHPSLLDASQLWKVIRLSLFCFLTGKET